jgi:predicted Rossmann-fold nucleotide-binding protein
MTRNRLELPFQPIRNDLYSSLDLLDGFRADVPASMASTLDFRTYRYFIANGGPTPTNPYAGMMEALHDDSILRALAVFLHEAAKPTVAIMGGHRINRDDPKYAQVVAIARGLTKRGCLVASGGGPGAMEATHLGALLADEDDGEVAAALECLATVPRLPESADVVRKGGHVDEKIVADLHAWAAPAFELGTRYLERGGQSLAVPTWYYGNEPTSALATNVAKFFQNSIREDILLSLAANGIIYTAGSAGTLQEVFQDAAQNFYRKEDEPFAPMIFFGESTWKCSFPVIPVLQALFVGDVSDKHHISQQDFDRYVKVVDTVEDAVDALIREKPTMDKITNRMRARGMGPMMASALR